MTSTNIHTCTKIIPILYHEHAIELVNLNFGFLSLEYSNYDITLDTILIWRIVNLQKDRFGTEVF